MKKIILAATVLASLGFAATAQAGRDDDERRLVPDHARRPRAGDDGTESGS